MNVVVESVLSGHIVGVKLAKIMGLLVVGMVLVIVSMLVFRYQIVFVWAEKHVVNNARGGRKWRDRIDVCFGRKVLVC